MNTQTTTATKRTSNAAKSRRVNNTSSRTRRATTKTSAGEPQPISEILPEAVDEIKQTRTARQEAARQKRAELKAVSNMLKKAVQSGQIPPSEDGTINGLLRDMYAQQGHTELKTFDEWKEAGYIVRKGQKAILLWGKPRKHNAGEDTEQQTSEQQDDFFPVCYVFSNLQVHAMKEPKQA